MYLCMCVCTHARVCLWGGECECAGVCNYVVGGWVWNALVLMYLFTVLFCAFLIVVTVLMLFWLSCWYWYMHYFIVLVFIWVCMKCFNIDVHIYSTALMLLHFLFLCFLGGAVCVCVLWVFSLFLFFVSFFLLGFFCHFYIDVYIYRTYAFLIVKWILMLIMYSTASLYIFMGYSAI